jgi:thymidine phosphorylase
MKYETTILVTYEDSSLERAVGRADEMKDAIPEWIAGSYGDRDVKAEVLLVKEIQ